MNPARILSPALVLFLGVSAALPAEAQDAEEELEVDLFFEEAETVTSATRHEQEIGMSPSAITVITREDIEASGATTIPDLLRLVPGMDVVVASPFFTAITSRLYWNYENVLYLVLVDGREANLELLGMVPFEIQPLAIEDIERIEVIRGPGSSLYGANAVAGVVSIVTRSVPERTSAWFRAGGGEAGQTRLGARASTRIGKWGVSVSGGVNLAGTFENPRLAGKRVWKFRTLMDYRFSSDQRLSLDFGMSEGRGSVAAPLGMLDVSLGLATLRMAYDSDSVHGQLVWNRAPYSGNLDSPLEYAGVRLARFRPIAGVGNTLDAEVHGNLPRFWTPLLLMVGGGGRASWMASNDLLDADSFADITSPDYHQAGLVHREVRLGAFVHAELSPVDWVTVTGDVRLDHNTVTGAFLSPRVAAVFRPAEGHTLRLGAARAFRKPAFYETHLHLMAEFPDTSPITGTARDRFQEFMTRVMGNGGLSNEELTSFEIGYLGRFLGGRLQVSLDLYYNLLRDLIILVDGIVPDENGLPDLGLSSFQFTNGGPEFDAFGGELAVRFQLTRDILLLASWSHREVIDRASGSASDESPKNLFTLGGRFRTGWGLVGSLHACSRSEFWNPAVQNPGGILQANLRTHMDNYVLVIARLGWTIALARDAQIETGLKFFLPIAPGSEPYFRYREAGGGLRPDGTSFGGDELRRVVAAYLQGAF